MYGRVGIGLIGYIISIRRWLELALALVFLLMGWDRMIWDGVAWDGIGVINKQFMY